MVVLCCDYEDVWMYKMANFCFLTSAMKCLRGEGRGGGVGDVYRVERVKRAGEGMSSIFYFVSAHIYSYHSATSLCVEQSRTGYLP